MIGKVLNLYQLEAYMLLAKLRASWNKTSGAVQLLQQGVPLNQARPRQCERHQVNGMTQGLQPTQGLEPWNPGPCCCLAIAGWVVDEISLTFVLTWTCQWDYHICIYIYTAYRSIYLLEESDWWLQFELHSWFALTFPGGISSRPALAMLPTRGAMHIHTQICT